MICNSRVHSNQLNTSKGVIVMTNNTIQKNNYNIIREIQRGIINMLLKKKNRRRSKNIAIREQQSDYVRFDLDILILLL